MGTGGKSKKIVIDDLKPKRLTDEEINAHATAFLGDHPSYNSIPVDIESIVELDLRMDIIPLPGLKSLSKSEADAFISRDLKAIRVDQFIVDSRENRYRFTLAHEMGHAVLHPEFYEYFTFQSLEEWASAIPNIPPRILDPFEAQADEFAGRVLVPRSALKRRYPSIRRKAEERVLLDFPELDIHDPGTYQDCVEAAVVYELAQIFVVSTGAMRIRLRKEKLIPRRVQAV